MKLKEYTSVIFDKVVIYKEMGIGDYIDLYKGDRFGIPETILDMEVRSIGANSKNTLDILVKIN